MTKCTSGECGSCDSCLGISSTQTPKTPERPKTIEIEATNYPEQIETEFLTHFHLGMELADLQFEAGQIANATAADIATNPEYKNDTARKVEIKLRLATNETYQRIDRRIREIELRRARTAARVERLRGEFAVWKIKQRAAIAAAELVAA